MADLHTGVERHFHPLKQTAGLCNLPCAADESVFHVLAAEEDVVVDGGVRIQIEFLKDDADAGVHGHAGRIRVQGLAVEDDLAALLAVDRG